jgi:hypothetical protein
VIPRPKKWESRKENVKTTKEPVKTKESEIEPNQSKDRVMHEGDNPLF